MFCTTFVTLEIRQFATHVTITKTLRFRGAEWMRIVPEILTPNDYILMINCAPISWKSRRQDNVSLYTSEAEFVSASQAGQVALYLRETFTDVAYSQTKPWRFSSFSL